MRRRKRSVLLLVFGLLSLAYLIYLILSYPPNFQFSILNFQFSIIPFFFLLLFIPTFSLSTYALKNARRGLFITLFVTIFLLFRLNNLTHPFFPILLLAILIILELFCNKR